MNLRAQRLIAMVMTAVGLAGVIAMIVVEDEPGLLPLLVLVCGLAWLAIAHSRIRHGPPGS